MLGWALRVKSKERSTDGLYLLEGDKSISQRANDTLSGKPGDKGVVEQVSDAASNAAKYVQDTATGTSFYISTYHCIKQCI